MTAYYIAAGVGALLIFIAGLGLGHLGTVWYWLRKGAKP